MDTFFTQKNCDRCGGSLSSGRIMSMYNTDCICMDCKRKEREREDYVYARDVEMNHVLAGDRNFAGVGSVAIS